MVNNALPFSYWNGYVEKTLHSLECRKNVVWDQAANQVPQTEIDLNQIALFQIYTQASKEVANFNPLSVIFVCSLVWFTSNLARKALTRTAKTMPVSWLERGNFLKEFSNVKNYCWKALEALSSSAFCPLITSRRLMMCVWRDGCM